MVQFDTFYCHLLSVKEDPVESYYCYFSASQMFELIKKTLQVEKERSSSFYTGSFLSESKHI